MIDPTETSNPFPGLRPFESEEDYLFFGRETIVDELLTRLRETRFLAVLGSSGSGKSSLVRAGLIPALYSGYMSGAGSSWRIAVMRPGSDPIGNLAVALNQPDVLDSPIGDEQASTVLTEVTLRRSDLGLIECVRQARIPSDENLLIVVDQFEELFRFKHSGQSQGARDEAVAFVKRLLSASEQQDLPIFVILTMRSDFIGECNEYPGLPKAINKGQYLVPRMSREQLRSAIVGPVLVAGGEISPRLVVRLLNDVGDNPDRLPILQHALMRTWNYWQEHGDKDGPIDIQHYEAIGTLEHALSNHADEAGDELNSDRARNIAAKIFKAITDTSSDSRGVRRPTTVGRLCLIAEATTADIASIVDKFREPGRSFLMPPINVPLEPDTVIDISHESLMRNWVRLIGWTKEENASAKTYLRLARAAARHEKGRTGLWRDPDLAIGLKWREQTRPTEAWASQYSPGFERVIEFLDRSARERDRLAAQLRDARRRKLQTAWGVSVVLLVFALYAVFQQQRAEQEKQRAEQNFELAVHSVDAMLADVAIEESLADIPQTEELRQRLLEQARTFFEALREDPAADPDLRLEMALAQGRLGKIYQYQGQLDEAEAAHLEGIEQLSQLNREFDDRPLFRLRLSEAYNALGEQYRPYDSARSEAAYDSALQLQQDLVENYPDEPDYRSEFGQTYHNRGILIGNQNDRAGDAERSFETAIELFDMLRSQRDDQSDILRLAQTKNDFAIFLRDTSRYDDAVTAYREAIVLMRELIEANPERRKYRELLARFYNNLGNLHLLRSDPELAHHANIQARSLFEGLASPAHALRVEIANNNNTRGRILAILNRTREAAEAYETALQQFARLEMDTADFQNDPGLNERYGNTLANSAILNTKERRFDEASKLVSRAIAHYKNVLNSPAPSSGSERNLANSYWLLADIQLKSGDYVKAVEAIENLVETAQDNGIVYRAAVLYARAIDLALDNAALSVGERGTITESYAQRTISLLDLAIRGGYPLERLEADVERRFNSIRDREDFRRVLSRDR